LPATDLRERGVIAPFVDLFIIGQRAPMAEKGEIDGSVHGLIVVEKFV
jgi:hypothetical protein